MFGTLRPRPCALPRDDRGAWRQLYCGTCRGLGDHSLGHRALLSHDVVLLAAIVEGVQAAPSPAGTCRCPIAPTQHRPILVPESPSIRIAAAVQVRLADAWLADQATDGTPMAGWFRGLLAPSDRRAAAVLSDLGLDGSGFARLTEAQAEAEARPGARIDTVAHPTAAMLGRLLGSVVDLPGTAPPLRTPSARRALTAIGVDLGRAIYVLDALEDLHDDLRTGAYNPCVRDGAADPARVHQAVRFVRQVLARLGERVRAFPWLRHEALIHQVLAERLPRRVERAVAATGEDIPEAPASGRKKRRRSEDGDAAGGGNTCDCNGWDGCDGCCDSLSCCSCGCECDGCSSCCCDGCGCD